jgi:hypothetical protein
LDTLALLLLLLLLLTGGVRPRGLGLCVPFLPPAFTEDALFAAGCLAAAFDALP